MIPVNEPSLNGRSLEYVSECVRTGWVSSAGRFINEFEDQWAAYCGRKHGIAVANGTVALQLAIAALDLQPGDEVIMPSFTIISCALAVIYNGGVPVLVDSDPRSWCLDVDQVKGKITPRTRAIMPVHIYGHPVDMDPLLQLASEYGLAIIEDAAEAHGAEYLSKRGSANERWHRCGSFGTMSTFSFYANKLITTGEGGMVVTDDPALADTLRSMRNLCFQTQRRFYHEALGFNFRLTNIQAALGLAQLEGMPEIIERKRRIGQTYNQRLRGISALRLPIEESWARSVYWMYGIVLTEDSLTNADGLAETLKKLGVETRPFFLGMHEQPVFHKRGLFKDEHYPVAEELGRQGLYLPSGLGLTDEQMDRVCAAVFEVLA
jgi:perosamine synthetase